MEINVLNKVPLFLLLLIVLDVPERYKRLCMHPFDDVIISHPLQNICTSATDADTQSTYIVLCMSSKEPVLTHTLTCPRVCLCRNDRAGVSDPGDGGGAERRP